jgi:hypothetical protein
MTTSRVLPFGNVKKLDSVSDVPLISYLVPPESLRFDTGFNSWLMYLQLPVHCSPAILEMTGKSCFGSAVDVDVASLSSLPLV